MSKPANTKEMILGTILWIVIGTAAWLYFTRDKVADPPVQAAAAIPAEAQAPAKPAAPVLTPEQVAAKEKEKRYGHHCLSGWDGSHRRFVEAVKDRLNDPRSFDHLETTTWPVREDGRNAILMRFSARNAFGGVIQARAFGSFANDTCDDAQVEKVE